MPRTIRGAPGVFAAASLAPTGAFKAGVHGDDKLGEALREHVALELGPIAKPESIAFLPTLPKTRSGKIMRRLLRARALGLPEGDTSPLEE